MIASLSERPVTVLKKAIPLVVFAAFGNALMALFVRLVSSSAPLALILFARFFLTFVLLVFVILWQQGKSFSFMQSLKTDRLGLHLFRDFSSVASVWSYFYAAKMLSLATATILFSTSPFFIPIIAFFWLRLKILHILWIGMMIGFVGVLLIVHPGKDAISWPALMGLFSGISAAFAYTSARLLAYTESPTQMMWYYFVVGTLVSFVYFICTSSFSMLLSLNDVAYLYLLGIGISGYAYQWGMSASMKFAPVRILSPILFSTTIFGLLFDWVIWHQVPPLLDWVGIALIILGGVLMVILYPKEDMRTR